MPYSNKRKEELDDLFSFLAKEKRFLEFKLSDENDKNCISDEFHEEFNVRLTKVQRIMNNITKGE